ncbi:VRR-NUC domain-containing protein [Kaistia terrae]|uniref:VRR-NUC domain-containing protein n=1 Tax=Kaistia terrae TaxID=537017 RepID=A0ABW0Q324_9HYPH|nr:VRR-NUC domain-containing protein [Kaistia terrae]MCX5581467.1 VRR-NUC domain-containing protein [Kaistia terrae]
MTMHAISLRDPRPVSEESIQRAVIQHLKLTAAPGVVYFHCPNGEARSKATGARLKAMGVRRGVADICLVLPSGRSAFLELKSAKGRPSDEQKAFAADVSKSGALYAVAASIDQALQILIEWGALNARKEAA